MLDAFQLFTEFLRDTGQITGEVPFRRGTVSDLCGGEEIIEVAWDGTVPDPTKDADLPEHLRVHPYPRVNAHNLERMRK